jgi:hypothetical protein
VTSRSFSSERVEFWPAADGYCRSMPFEEIAIVYRLMSFHAASVAGRMTIGQ